MKRIFKTLGFLLLITVVLGFITFLSINESLPAGINEQGAERLIDEVFSTLNKPGYDSIRYIEFTFKGVHRYQWDREKEEVIVHWADQDVKLNLGIGVDNYNETEYQAYKYFVNDSFWLVAPFKARDEGVSATIVEVKNARGLLLSYSSGGLTPGDSYLWIVDKSGFPKAWKLWTSNVPIGGLMFSWENWTKLEGVYFSTLHQSTILNLEITDLKVRH